ncbi:hypothetical protein [Thalassotalea sp. ND16A]|uniref:hypothetical protein n=1 Tax=Thalassotalea sp. ND16A TaxID=1535422 RepID=UPI00051A0462|nr:hypothetical protein [Thalassotalea sp. ND16A]KGJ90492.1 hypothetical protein ND16A_1888 [Thalassotalea sp. ND16A]
MSKLITKTLACSMLIMVQMLFGTVSAAEAKPDSLADLWIVVPNPGQNEKFEQAFKQHIKFRAEKGDPRPWKTYVPVVGKNLNYYAVRFCCTKFNDIESYVTWGTDNKIQAHWNMNVDQYVAHYEHYYSRVDFENSNWPEGEQGYKYFGVTDYSAKMGKGKSISAGKKMLSDNAKAMKWPYSWSWSWQIGGDGNLSLVIPYNDYAGMTPPDKSFAKVLAEHLGDEAKAGEIFKQWSDNFHSTNYTVYRLRDDMSMSED